MNTTFRKSNFIGTRMPLLNRGSWNPALHPRDPSNGEFVYTDGGLHGRSRSGRRNSNSVPRSYSASAIQAALSLSIDQNTRRRSATPTNPYFSHYGYSDDQYKDTNSNVKRLGNHNNTLNDFSLSISSDVARANHLRLGDPVYINGVFLGHYDDSPARWVHNTIDVYDPNNRVGSQNWGGMIPGGARISSSR